MNDQTGDECGICLEVLTAAVTLPCKHKFCASCLDGWKSKFGSSLFNKKVEKSKSCPLCREKIPPSKDMLIQLNFHRRQKRYFESKGDTTSEAYWNKLEHIRRLEAEIGDYDGEGLDYDDDECIELPKYIFESVNEPMFIKMFMDWLGSPVDMDKLSARYPDHANSTLVHLAIDTDKSDLLSIVLQYGADVNASNALGFTPLMLATEASVDQAKILLEWGAEIALTRSVILSYQDKSESNKDAFIRMANEVFGNNELANLVSSEFGGRRCEVINLPNHPQMNGKACIVEKYITKKDRYKIIFEGSGKAALVGPSNLKRRDRIPMDCGYYISFKNGRMSRREFCYQRRVSSICIFIRWWRCKGTRGGVGKFEVMRFYRLYMDDWRRLG